jgi:hypothetical protein
MVVLDVLHAAEERLRAAPRIIRGAAKTLFANPTAQSLPGGVDNLDELEQAASPPPQLTRHQILSTIGVPSDQKAYAAEKQDGAEAADRFGPKLHKSFLCYERQHAKYRDTMRLPNLVADLLRPDPNGSQRKITGRDRLATIKTTLDSFGLDRSETQREFHDVMICACAQQIFRDDLDEELDDLLQEYGITELQTEAMFITPRRWGKTYSVAMFVVAIALGIEAFQQPFDISIFSTGRRASQKLLELIYAFICKIAGMKEMIIKHTVETIWLQGPNGDGDVRKISSFPSKVKVCVGVVSVVGVVGVMGKESESGQGLKVR